MLNVEEEEWRLRTAHGRHATSDLIFRLLSSSHPSNLMFEFRAPIEFPFVVQQYWEDMSVKITGQFLSLIWASFSSPG